MTREGNWKAVGSKHSQGTYLKRTVMTGMMEGDGGRKERGEIIACDGGNKLKYRSTRVKAK